MTAIKLGESKSEVVDTFKGNKRFTIKYNNDAITIFDGPIYIGYAILINDTVDSITKIWINKETGYNVTKEFQMLFTLLNKDSDKLYNANIQLQNIQEPSITYKAIIINIGLNKRIVFDENGITENLSKK